MWKANILTLFPELFPGALAHSVPGVALQKGIWSLDAKNIRDFAKDARGTVDEVPYGGGGGMVIKPDIIGPAIEASFLTNEAKENQIIYMSPRGHPLNQRMAERLSAEKGINIVCGRFEGIDQRVILRYNITEISIGDYVLSSGDTAAIVLLDACIRLLPGVLDRKESMSRESFGSAPEYKNLLQHPHYTRPRLWQGMEVPQVLTSGNHALIESWRHQMALEKTRDIRPDLINKRSKK